ncbi:HD domain-containing protein, partial [Myxococcus sp. AM009]|nr:HD domain-containing protein [Myxococcus sp. AM009]
MLKVLQLCVIHDLGEATPAIRQGTFPNKSEQERTDLVHPTQTLGSPLRERILPLWEEYEQAASPEAQALEALDKLETLPQHTQSADPPDFDDAFKAPRNTLPLALRPEAIGGKHAPRFKRDGRRPCRRCPHGRLPRPFRRLQRRHL